MSYSRGTQFRLVVICGGLVSSVFPSIYNVPLTQDLHGSVRQLWTKSNTLLHTVKCKISRVSF